jgi:membrane protein implicated in regulation of membrane protease activity
MLWWYWMILGSALLAIELFAIDTQFYLIFIGVSAAIVGLAGLLGIDLPVWAEWLTFAVLSIVFMVTFRKSLYEKLRSGGEDYKETLEGEDINISSALEVGAEGREDYRGTKWTVRNVGTQALLQGSRARVTKVDGLTLHVEAE